MGKLGSFFFCVLILLPCYRGLACWTNEELSVLDPEVQIKTYFWMPQLKRGLRIAQMIHQGRPYFIMIGCRESKSPSVETMDDWSSAECEPLGNIWLPLVEPNTQKSGEIPYYIEKIQESLEESRKNVKSESLSDKAIGMATHLLSLTLGITLFSAPYFYQRDTTKGETKDRKAGEMVGEQKKERGQRRNWRRFAKRGLIPIRININMSHIFKLIGGLWVVKTLHDVYEEYVSWGDEENISREDESLAELEQLLLAIEGGWILHLDGEEADRRIDQLFTFDSLLSAFKYASDQTYQKICQKEKK